jgi:hypothetical protein
LPLPRPNLLFSLPPHPPCGLRCCPCRAQTLTLLSLLAGTPPRCRTPCSPGWRAGRTRRRRRSLRF